MKKQLQIFFDFLRFCIGSAKEIPGSLKEVDWKELYAIAKKQCLVGVLFDGIKKLPAEYVGMEKEATASMDGGKPDVGEGECSVERCCHTGF